MHVIPVDGKSSTNDPHPHRRAKPQVAASVDVQAAQKLGIVAHQAAVLVLFWTLQIR